MEPAYRKLLIAASFVVMMVISIYQYSWFLFAYAIQQDLHWDLASVGLTFTVFAYAATFVQPFSGFIADHYGPRKVAVSAALLVGIGFILASTAASPASLYVYYGLGGLGVVILYGISTACAVKWFPDRRGFATGLVVFGFGAGTALFNFFIQRLLSAKGVDGTFMWIGCFMIVVLVPLSLLYVYPGEQGASRPGDASPREKAEPTNYRPGEMLRTYQWFLMYFSFAATVSIVLMFGAQMKALAREFRLPQLYFSWLLILFPLGNGLSRVVAGAISDRIGRENTMMIFYSILGLSIFAFVFFAHVHFLFMPIVFFAALLGGAPFALYPATVGDYYGPRYATVNYGITYTAKAWAGLISGWLSGFLALKFGSFKIQLLFLAGLCLVAAVLSHPRWMKSPLKTGRRG